MKTCIVIYSGWTTGKDGAWTIFDHPEPLPSKGLIGRMLKSFVKSKVKAPTIIFPSSQHPSVEKHVQMLVKPYEDKLDLHVVTGKEMKRMVKDLKDHGFPKEFDDVWDIGNYGRYRNWKVLYAAFHGFDNFLTHDDDQMIERPGYVENICEKDIGTKYKGVEVLGKSGCYIDAKGSRFYDGQITEITNWPKDRLFNEAIKNQVDAPTRLSRAQVALGGNMMTNRKMFLKVPYDINIPRGEDDDYTTNAEYLGFTYFFDHDMYVRHLPPSRTKYFWTRMRQDIKRFKYLREKLRIFKIDMNKINVFYKYFLQEDLEYKGVSGSIDAARKYMDKDRKEAEEFLNNALVAAKHDRKEMIKLVEKQLRFMEAWGKVLPKIEGMYV